MKPDHLVLEISFSKVDLLRLIDTAHMVDLRNTAVDLPLPLAAPANECEHTMLVAKIIDCVILTPDVLETDKVHIHMLDILDLSLKILRSISKENIVRPAGTLEKDILAIESKLPVTILVKVALDFSDTECNVHCI